MALAELGYYHGSIDGVLGWQSRNALIAFQRDAGLPMTGRLDSATIAELGLA